MKPQISAIQRTRVVELKAKGYSNRKLSLGSLKMKISS